MDMTIRGESIRMNIQWISYSGNKTNNLGDIEVTKLSSPRSIDMYDLNIIDLTDNDIWLNYEEDPVFDSNCCTQDIKNLDSMVSLSSKAKILYLLPRDLEFLTEYYDDYAGSKEHQTKVRLKNILNEFFLMLPQPAKLLIDSVVYESTVTTLQNQVDADFHFIPRDKFQYDKMLKSYKSNKITFLSFGRLFVTSLQIEEIGDFYELLNVMGISKKIENKPQWMEGIQMFDDVEQIKKIESSQNVIEKMNTEINQSKIILSDNDRLKSILFTQSDSLVEVVFEILEEMLGCDLSKFEDKRNEDFLFDLGGKHFIGEIKGVTSNVRSEHVSQLDVHLNSFKDDHQNIEESDIYSILIINHQRNKPLSDRQPVCDAQIKLSKRNGSLIVETITLLKLLEKYRNKEYSRDKVIELLTNKKVGILELS
ncbi:hypothetical protein NHG26_06445 [Aerococcaceae bacterium NML201296]|nr:hypothetical protein [Aerococcaceae bacterium NML201296]